MNVVCYRLRPATPWSTPWEADSLFGALCWELVRRNGEADLQALLTRFRNGDPPWVISDAFPGDFLPRPLATAQGPPWLTREQFRSARRAESGPPAGEQPGPFLEMQDLRIAANRDRIETEAWTCGDAPNFFTLYARTLPEWVEPLRQLLAGLGAYGFGKHRTLGRGRFEVDSHAEPCPWLDPMPFENGFVSLGHFVPDDGDPTRGRWTLHVKYPKFGEARGGESRPFKGRLLQLGPGSCFQSPGRPKRWYGRMITGLAGNAVHYGLALAIGIKWPP